MRTLVTLAAILGLHLSASAADGDLDPGFGTGGIARTGLTNALTNGALMGIPPVIQPDGKILICGTKDTGGPSGSDIFVARFTANGVLDTSFSFDGRQTIDFDGGAGADSCAAIALQTDGKIVVVGTTSTGVAQRGDFAIARLNSDGTLDTATFGAGTGKTTVGFDLGGSNEDNASSMAIQSDGKILVAGAADTSNGTDFAVVRLDTGGTRDPSFNFTGKVTVGFNLSGSTTKDDIARCVAIDAAGNIVLGGTADNGTNGNDIAVARLLPGGTLDSNFDADGRATVAFDLGGAGGSNSDFAFAITIQRDGKIVLAGASDTSSSSTPNFDMAVARLQPDGSPDSSFGIAGRTLVPFDLVANGADLAVAVAEQNNGKLVLAGQALVSAGIDAAVVRLNANGSPDAEFGALGKKTFEFGLSTQIGQAFTGVAFQGTQIIASGVSDVGPSGSALDNILVRLQNDLLFADGFE